MYVQYCSHSMSRQSKINVLWFNYCLCLSLGSSWWHTSTAERNNTKEFPWREVPSIGCNRCCCARTGHSRSWFGDPVWATLGTHPSFPLPLPPPPFPSPLVTILSIYIHSLTQQASVWLVIYMWCIHGDDCMIQPLWPVRVPLLLLIVNYL